VAAFLFAVWMDFFSINKKDAGVVTFAFGLLPIIGSIFFLKGSLLLFAVAIISLIVYVGAFVMMLARYNEHANESDEKQR